MNCLRRDDRFDVIDAVASLGLAHSRFVRLVGLPDNHSDASTEGTCGCTLNDTTTETHAFAHCSRRTERFVQRLLGVA